MPNKKWRSLEQNKKTKNAEDRTPKATDEKLSKQKLKS